MADVIRQLTHTFTFDADLENWQTSGTTSHVTTDGYPGAGSLRIYFAGKNTTVTPSITWSGTYESLGIPSNATITGISATLYEKQNTAGLINDAYWNLWYEGTNNLIASVNDFTTFDWTLVTGTPVTGLSIVPSTTLNLTLDGYIRSGNDNSTVVEMFWDTIALEFTYTIPFQDPTISDDGVTSLGIFGVTLNGSVTSMGDAQSIDLYFQYRTVGSGTWVNTTPATLTIAGGHSEVLSGLLSNTQYEYRVAGEYTGSALTTIYTQIAYFTTLKDTFTLTVEVVGNGTTTPSAGTQQYPEDEIINLSAAPSVGSHFVKWIIDGTDVFSSSSQVILSESKTVTAYFGDYKALSGITEDATESTSKTHLLLGLFGSMENSTETNNVVKFIKRFISQTENGVETNAKPHLLLRMFSNVEDGMETQAKMTRFLVSTGQSEDGVETNSVFQKILVFSGQSEDALETQSTFQKILVFSGVAENSVETSSKIINVVYFQGQSENNTETLSKMISVMYLTGNTESLAETAASIHSVLYLSGGAETAAESDIKMRLLISLNGQTENTSETDTYLHMISGLLAQTEISTETDNTFIVASFNPLSGESESSTETLSNMTFKIPPINMRIKENKVYLRGEIREGNITLDSNLTAEGNLKIGEIIEGGTKVDMAGTDKMRITVIEFYEDYFKVEGV